MTINRRSLFIPSAGARSFLTNKHAPRMSNRNNGIRGTYVRIRANPPKGAGS